MLTKLAGIAKVAKERPQEKFTSLAHLISVDMLRMCDNELDGKKATGVDAVTKKAYSENLEKNLEDLVNRMKQHAYRPQPVRREYIPKPGTKEKRPLGIPAYEDKLVQAALSKILTAIYEQEFLDSSFGFRPKRVTQHWFTPGGIRCWKTPKKVCWINTQSPMLAAPFPEQWSKGSKKGI